jgi:hypothetical protein
MRGGAMPMETMEPSTYRARGGKRKVYLFGAMALAMVGLMIARPFIRDFERYLRLRAM